MINTITYQHALKRSVPFLPIGKFVGFGLPYAITPEALDFVAVVTSECIVVQEHRR